MYTKQLLEENSEGMPFGTSKILQLVSQLCVQVKFTGDPGGRMAC